MPTRKVGWGVFAGATVLVGAWVVREFAKVEIPADIQSAMQILITFGVQYAVPDAEA